MASRLIDDDPELAHSHAMSAARRAGRIAVVRESLAITAYETGDYALALRELRTFRRISGSDEQLPLMVDSERGVGRPEKALELGRSVDRSTLSPASQVSLAIAMSGARLDLGSPELALGELEIPQLDPDRAFSYSAALYDAYAEVLSELGRDAEAAVWRRRATVAGELFGDGPDEDETIEIVEEDGDDSGGESEPADAEVAADGEVADVADDSEAAVRDAAPAGADSVESVGETEVPGLDQQPAADEPETDGAPDTGDGPSTAAGDGPRQDDGTEAALHARGSDDDEADTADERSGEDAEIDIETETDIEEDADGAVRTHED
jgi:hypothetical protein